MTKFRKVEIEGMVLPINDRGNVPLKVIKTTTNFRVNAGDECGMQPEEAYLMLHHKRAVLNVPAGWDEPERAAKQATGSKA